MKCLNKQWKNKMNQCYKPNPSNRIQEGADKYLWKDISNRSIQDHFIAGAELMQAQVEEWLKKSGRGQMIGSLNRFLDNKVDESRRLD